MATATEEKTEAPQKPESENGQATPAPETAPDPRDAEIQRLADKLRKQEEKCQRLEHFKTKSTHNKELAIELSDLKSALEGAKEEVKELNAAYKKKSIELARSVISDEAQKKLFDDDKPRAPADKAPVSAPAGTIALPAGADPHADAAIIVLMDYGMTKNECKKLLEQGFETIGKLEAFMRKNSEFWSRDIKGFADAKITKLQDAHTAYRIKFPYPEPGDTPAAAKEEKLASKEPPALQERPPFGLTVPEKFGMGAEVSLAFVAGKLWASGGKLWLIETKEVIAEFAMPKPGDLAKLAHQSREAAIVAGITGLCDRIKESKIKGHSAIIKALDGSKKAVLQHLKEVAEANKEFAEEIGAPGSEKAKAESASAAPPDTPATPEAAEEKPVGDAMKPEIVVIESRSEPPFELEVKLLQVGPDKWRGAFRYSRVIGLARTEFDAAVFDSPEKPNRREALKWWARILQNELTRLDPDDGINQAVEDVEEFRQTLKEETAGAA